MRFTIIYCVFLVLTVLVPGFTVPESAAAVATILALADLYELIERT